MLPHPNLDRSVMKRNQARVLHLNKNKKMSIFRKKKHSRYMAVSVY